MRRRPPPRLSSPFLPALLAAALALPVHAQAQQPRAAPPDRLIPLEVSINTVQVGSWTLLERGGTLYAPEEALVEWRLERDPSVQPLLFRGGKWYPLAAVPGFQARINAANQSVELVFSPTAFAATQLVDKEQKRLPVTPAEPALFLNVDTSVSLVKPRGASVVKDVGVIGEVGYAGSLGVLTTSFLATDLLGNDAERGRKVTRLETTLTRDFPDRNLTMRLGDGTTRAGMWGRGVYFGGVQLTRNFGLTPGIITQPIPLITGASSAPSTVELYVNDTLRQTSVVPTGPFVVQNFPVLSGSGEARVVVRDVLGRETVIVQPFFANAELLAQGLTDWSAEAGAVRLGLGRRSNDYGSRFVAGTYKFGWSRDTTLETRVEFSSGVRNVGVGVIRGLFNKVLAQAAVAVSRGKDGGSGHEWLAGLSHDSLRHGFTLRAQGASADYVQLGLDRGLSARKAEYSASYTYNAEQLGAFGAGLARIEAEGARALNTATLSYSRRIGSRSSFTLTAARVSGAVDSTSFAATLTVPLDNLLTVGGNFSHRGGRTDAYASVDKGLGGETGVAWRMLAGTRDSAPFSEAGMRLHSEHSLLTADVSASSNQQAVRLGAQTGLVFVGGKAFITQRVQDSFALVQVPGFADVGVGFHGRTQVHTDKDGDALLPRLMPYQPNSVTLNASDLPINAELDTIELQAVPPARSAVKIVFPVRSGRGALLRIVFDDGEPAPPGAEVELVGEKGEFFVARRGESFVTGMKDRNALRLKWKGASCTFEANLPPGAVDEIARVGPLACKGVKR